ncbi:hypothetical protein E3N88_40194 [Mikania micrantha]|uniref:Uncharacterized protein n=1 Tax=Mikania micrantha TaxID=192012 RepID=A0A5N6LM09_9ASTR|nr:hypothetical protein E3N88_40194 [Mikania micrantha]
MPYNANSCLQLLNLLFSPTTSVFDSYFSRVSEQKVFIARKAEFLETKFLSEGTSGRTVELEEVQDSQDDTHLVDTSNQHEDVENDHVDDQDTQNIRRSGRISVPPERYGFFMDGCYVVDSDEPTTYRDAMSKPDFDKWQEAMNIEMQSMYDNQVWELVTPPLKSKVVGSKWVFKKKTDMHGNLDTYKARLVAKGFTQTQGVDYDETFSPVAMLKSIRILFAIAAYYDYEIWQMDVKTAFLNGYLEEDVHMEQPEGFVDPKHPNKVCKLKKSIYGLKQASRSWNHRFDDEIKKFGFIKNADEACVYKKASGSIITFLVLYVDDILLFGNDIPTLQGVKAWLGSCFSIKDLGEAAYILGIKIYRDRSRRLIGLNQSAYIDKVLKRFKMENSKKGLVPIQKGTILSRSQCPSSKVEQERMNGVPYASAIGSIMYAMICTRPDVSCALSMTSRYQQNPGNSHWMAVKGILKYHRNTKDMFLTYGSGEEELVVKGYTDASFQTDRDDSRSQSGYVFIMNGGAVSWKSSKQDVVALSTTESEYIAASLAAQEAAWLRKFIADLGVVATIQDPLEIFCDNEGAIAQIKEPRAHQKTRHIERRFNYIRDEVEKGKICIRKVHTDQNIADPFTKLLERTKHESHTCSLGLRYSRPELIQEPTDKIAQIQQRLQATRSRQNSYADKRRKPLEFQVGDRVMLKVSPWKGVVRFAKKGKLTPRYVGPFEIIERIGPVAYKLRLPDELSEPLEIMGRKVKQLRRSRIPIVKVRWNSKRGPEFTWEREDHMKHKYPQLFTEEVVPDIDA